MSRDAIAVKAAAEALVERIRGEIPLTLAMALAVEACDGESLRLRVPNLPYGPPAGRFIAAQLEEVGIDVVLDELEFPARWLDLVYTKFDYDMTIVPSAAKKKK